jgi:branched-chain amino acid transport system permease protein
LQWLLSAAMFFVLAGVFMGVQLELDGTKLVVDTAADIRWQWIFIGTAVVFFFQLLRPLFQKTLKNVSGPKFIMPAIDGSTVKQKLFLIACWLSPWRGRLWCRAGRWISPP